MRPLLPDEGSSSEGKVISYPTSMEAHGRSIDLVQSGMSRKNKKIEKDIKIASCF